MSMLLDTGARPRLSEQPITQHEGEMVSKSRRGTRGNGGAFDGGDAAKAKQRVRPPESAWGEEGGATDGRRRGKRGWTGNELLIICRREPLRTARADGRSLLLARGQVPRGPEPAARRAPLPGPGRDRPGCARPTSRALNHGCAAGADGARRAPCPEARSHSSAARVGPASVRVGPAAAASAREEPMSGRTPGLGGAGGGGLRPCSRRPLRFVCEANRTRRPPLGPRGAPPPAPEAPCESGPRTCGRGIYSDEIRVNPN